VWELAFVVTAVATLVGCASGVTKPPTSPDAAPSRSIDGPTGTVSAPRPVAATVTLASCAAPLPITAHAVHHFAVSPDDIAVDPSARLWVTAREANLLISLNPDGSGISSQTVGGGLEGIVISPSGMDVAQHGGR
jgi:hypothetical protein